jgi:hypothetical protein
MWRYVGLGLMLFTAVASVAQTHNRADAKDSASKQQPGQVYTDKDGNTTVNIGSNNQVANESGTVDGKKWKNNSKVDPPKDDADEAFWGKGGFWGHGKQAP